MQKVQKEFFMGNGVTITDQAKAIKDLINRDHPRLIRFLEEYGPGKLGTYFVPPMFFSSTPDVIKLSEYDAKTRGKGKHKDGVRGQLAEQIMFNALKVYYSKRKDDVLILHSHKFLKNATEKDFILINVTKGYIMIIEVKASTALFQKAKKQMFDSKEKIEEICGILGPNTQWQFVGVFFALEDKSKKPLFDCSCPLPCDTFSIVGRENIENKLRKIDMIAIQNRANKLVPSELNPEFVEKAKIDKSDTIQKNKNWIPSEHISEFVELAKQFMFVVQGDSKAPVTGCNLVKKINNHVNAASTFEGILFWTPQQLSITTAVHLPYVFLDAFYSTGKSYTLQFISKWWSNEIGKGLKMYILISKFFRIYSYDNLQLLLNFGD